MRRDAPCLFYFFSTKISSQRQCLSSKTFTSPRASPLHKPHPAMTFPAHLHFVVIIIAACVTVSYRYHYRNQAPCSYRRRGECGESAWVSRWKLYRRGNADARVKLRRLTYCYHFSSTYFYHFPHISCPPNSKSSQHSAHHRPQQVSGHLRRSSW
jgi:hypothetical protein